MDADKKKVLIVEDDLLLSKSYRIKLEKAGFETKNVYDGNEALEALKTYSPSVIILDLMMPNRDGFSVIEVLKGNKKWKGIPIIVATNLGQEVKDEITKKFEIDEYVVKAQLSLNDLVDKINVLADGDDKTSFKTT